MANLYSISTQGINNNLNTATGSYDPIDYNDLTEDKALHLIKQMRHIRDENDYSSGDLCPPSFVIRFGNDEVFSFYINDLKIYYADAEKEVSVNEVLKIARGEKKFKMTQVRKDQLERDGVFPIRKRHILPTDKENISEENIDTGSKCPQFEHIVWRSRGWFEAAHTAPFAVGAFFLFVAIIVMGEGRDAEYAPMMFLIAAICFLLFFPWRAMAKTKMQAGVDWSTNTLWIKRGKKLLGFEPDANYIEQLVIQKYETSTNNPLWVMDPSMPMVFKKRVWLLQVKRVQNDYYWTFKGGELATKKEAKAVAEKFNNLLSTQM